MSTPSRTLFRLQVSGLGACIDPNCPAHLYHEEQAENKEKRAHETYPSEEVSTEKDTAEERTPEADVKWS